jgi:hypothetical protein
MSLTDFMGSNPFRDNIGLALTILVVIAVAVNLLKAVWMDLLRVWALVKRHVVFDIVRSLKKQAGEVVRVRPCLEMKEVDQEIIDQ